MPHDPMPQNGTPHDPSPDGPPSGAATVPLPERCDLAQLRTRAKDLRRAVQAGAPQALATVAGHHPAGAVDPARRGGFTLRDAQLTLARHHGYPGWHELVQAVGTRRVEERSMHRWFAVEFNNEVWDLLGGDPGVGADSPADDRDLVLYGAYAAARHWAEAGTVANQARAEYLIARAAAAVGLPETALRHARRCLDLVERHPDQLEDWDAPFAHEALARALAGTGDLDRAAQHRQTAVRLTAEVADPEDRTILEAELARGPWFELPVS